MTTRKYIILLPGLWLVVVYVIAFGFLQGFSFLFTQTYDFSTGLTGIAFSALGVGILLNTALAPVFARHHISLLKQWKSSHGDEEELPQEYLLLPIALTLPASLFWLEAQTTLTSYPSPPPAPSPPSASAGPAPTSRSTITSSIYNYVLDVYGIYTRSALATMVFVRYMFAGGMVVVSRGMWENLGVH